MLKRDGKNYKKTCVNEAIETRPIFSFFKCGIFPERWRSIALVCSLLKAFLYKEEPVHECHSSTPAYQTEIQMLIKTIKYYKPLYLEKRTSNNQLRN